MTALRGNSFMRSVTAWMIACALVVAGCDSERKAGPTLVASSAVAVVQTASGTVQGFVRGGTYTFRGIPYAKAERFMAPDPAPSWTGVRPALSYGHICLQPPNDQLREPQTFVSDNRFWPAAEACQNLNIWTPAVNDGGKRPVMVWLHGGGFFSGSSAELPIYDGTNLSREGDLVVVSLNHRLNVLGFLDLSAYGEVYRNSGNAGMLDIVAALQWVKANIARFGGDPANVTIFGQSGGGGKVSTLLAAPAARGLFHKAIVQSGGPGGTMRVAADRAVARRIAERTVEFAGLQPHEVDKLRALPYDRLLEAANRALAAVNQELKGGQPGMGGVNWAPVVDGMFLPEAPFGERAPEESRGVPLMVGSTLSEFNAFQAEALKGHRDWSPAEVLSWLRSSHGAGAEEIWAAYRTAYPELTPGLLPLIDTAFRSGVIRTARMKAAQGDSVYSYVFAWRSPVLDYAWAAGHSSELAFVFNNAKEGEQSSGGGPVVDRLTRQMSRAWINFARTGNPNGSGIPKWPVFTPGNPATMVFDSEPDVRIGHDERLVELLTRPPARPAER
jgi:para-nitrobenzyl esterase